MEIEAQNLGSEEIELDEISDLNFRDGRVIEDLSAAAKALLDEVQWFKNVKIENKAEERRRFLEESGDYTPEFEFEAVRKDGLKQLIRQCKEKSEDIGESHLEKYGAKILEAEDFQLFFQETFREMELYLELAENIEDEASWREISENIWPLPEEDIAIKSLEKLKTIESNKEKQRNVSPEKLADMFRNEVDRLEMDYSVDLQNTGGCHNIPEESTLVVAKGENGDRTYSREEAEMLTMHEVFHAVRAYNGFKAGDKSGFPPILGLHTPFYDQAEEGGALYREKATKVSYSEKEFDYHLRLVAAFKISESDNYREEFERMAEELVQLGASRKRAFDLLARNREALRHHIYQTGYEEWKDRDEIWPLLIGKVNEEWAEKFRKEVEADGMLQKPEIGEEELFDFNFKDST